MTNTQKFLPIAKLVQTARDGPAQGLPQQSYQSIPLPYRSGSNMFVVFMFCGCRPSPQGRLLLPPGYIAWIDASRGVLQELRAVTQDVFGIQHDPNQFLGMYSGPENIPPGDVRAYTEHFYNIYDNLLALYFTEQSSHKAGQDVKEFRRLFGLLAEPILEPYYRTIGKAFFDWIGVR
ncbi:MAG: hypothetical protein ABW161_10630 [Candidatus Thiodiazotropha sp.]